MPRKKRKSATATVLRNAGVLLLVVIAATLALVLPLRFQAPPTTAFMLQDRSGRDPVAYRWIDWPELSPHLALAVVAAEDQKFTAHFGFDLASIRDSVEDYQSGQSLRGASTLSQQLAKNLYLWPGRNFVRKGLEAWLTLAIEICLPKRRILELYLNVVEFGPGIYGAAAASRAFFGKPAGAVTMAEAALLAAVLPNPTDYDAARPGSYLRERQRWILGQMQRLRREGWATTLD